MKAKKFKFYFSDIIGTIFGILIFAVIPLTLLVLGLCLDWLSITSVNESGEEVREVFNLAELIVQNKNGELVFKFAYPIQALCITSVVLGAVGFVMAIVGLSIRPEIEAIIYIAGILLFVCAIIDVVMLFLGAFSIAGLRDSLKEIGSNTKGMAGYWIFLVGSFVEGLMNLFIGTITMDTIM